VTHFVAAVIVTNLYAPPFGLDLRYPPDDQVSNLADISADQTAGSWLAAPANGGK